MIRLTQHAQQRITERMQGITDVREIMDACWMVSDHSECETVTVKRLDKPMVVDLGESDFQQMSKGDEVVAIVRRGHITTVMLRKSWSQSNRY